MANQKTKSKMYHLNDLITGENYEYPNQWELKRWATTLLKVYSKQGYSVRLNQIGTYVFEIEML